MDLLPLSYSLAVKLAVGILFPVSHYLLKSAASLKFSLLALFSLGLVLWMMC